MLSFERFVNMYTTSHLETEPLLVVLFIMWMANSSFDNLKLAKIVPEYLDQISVSMSSRTMAMLECTGKVSPLNFIDLN